MPDDIEVEKQKIIALIRAESSAYFHKDFEGVARAYLHEPYVTRWGWWSMGGIVVRQGWDIIGPRLLETLRQNPEPGSSAKTFVHENFNIRVGADMAWVTFDQYASDDGQPAVDMPGLTREMRVLEKHDGEWKFAFTCFLHGPLPEYGPPIFRLDHAAHVMWKNPPAARALSGDAPLVIRAGKLGARNHETDRLLQDAIGHIAGLDDTIDPISSGIPIILDAMNGGPFTVCWVTRDSGMILVSLNDETMTEQRLEAASQIFGITPAQRKLASFIIAGQDLVAAAKSLGVSVNTARTHLQRMFDKVGVRSQPALVRALLSTVAPAR